MTKLSKQDRQLVQHWLTPAERTLFHSSRLVGQIVPLSLLMKIYGALKSLAETRKVAYILAKFIAEERSNRTIRRDEPAWVHAAMRHGISFRRYAMHNPEAGGAWRAIPVEAGEEKAVQCQVKNS